MIKTRSYQYGRPIIPIKLSLNGKTINDLAGLLDSGAGITTVSREHLITLGINLTIPALEYSETTDATGKTTNSPIYRVNVNIDDILIKENHPVACSSEQYKKVDLLIGTDILNDFILFLNGQAKCYTIAG